MVEGADGLGKELGAVPREYKYHEVNVEFGSLDSNLDINQPQVAKMHTSWMPLWLSIAARVMAQGSSTSSEPEVPTGTPINGDYTGQYRPQIHFSPPEFFINDPNGMFVDDNGTWHLYYQYNPTDYVAGNQHWGHATSQDLYHWENQPIALFPPDENTFIWSGSAVTDPNNTSGFFPEQTNGVVAIYVSRIIHSAVCCC